MMDEHLIEKAVAYLDKLCVEIDNRRTGSAGNRAATDFFADVVASFSFATEARPFDCLDWRQRGADLLAAYQGDLGIEIVAVNWLR